MGSAAAHEVAEDACVRAEGDNVTAADALWEAGQAAVEAAIEATASYGNSCMTAHGGMEELPVEVLQKFCEDAIEGVPLPKPWSLEQDAFGSIYFVNESTGTSQWDHPLGTALTELCILCRAYFRVPSDQRADLLAAVRRHWEFEAKMEYSRWYAAEDESGRTYHCHEKSGETTWDRPRTVVLPPYYMRLRAVARLCKDAYVDKLCRVSTDVRIQCITDKVVHPAEEGDVLHHRTNDRHIHSKAIQDADQYIPASGRRSCAAAYFIGDCPSIAAKEEQFQQFDLSAGDDSFETKVCVDMLAPPDPLSRWYEVY